MDALVLPRLAPDDDSQCLTSSPMNKSDLYNKNDYFVKTGPCFCSETIQAAKHRKAPQLRVGKAVKSQLITQGQHSGT